MVHLVLDDLGCPALVIFDPGLEIRGLPADLDLLIALTLPGTAQQRQAALLRFVGALSLEDLRIQHGGVGGPILEYNDILRHTDHVCRHAHAALLVMEQGIQQVTGRFQVVLRCGGGFS